MRAILTRNYQEEGGPLYAMGSLVKGATAKVLVGKRVAREVAASGAGGTARKGVKTHPAQVSAK